MSIQLGSGNVPPQTFLSYKDPDGNPLVSLNRDGTVTTQGVTFSDGTKQTTASSGGGSSNILDTQVSLTSAQVLGLFTTPVQLIPSPGAGKFIIPIAATFEYIFNSVAYTIGSSDAFNIYPAGAAAPAESWLSVVTMGFVDQTSTQFISAFNNESGPIGGSPVNVALDLNINTGALTNGNGTIKIFIQYIIETA